MASFPKSFMNISLLTDVRERFPDFYNVGYRNTKINIEMRLLLCSKDNERMNEKYDRNLVPTFSVQNTLLKLSYIER